MTRQVVRSVWGTCAVADCDRFSVTAEPKTRGRSRAVRVSTIVRRWNGSGEDLGVVVLSAADQLRVARLLLQAQGIPVPAAIGRAIRAASKVAR